MKPGLALAAVTAVCTASGIAVYLALSRFGFEPFNAILGGAVVFSLVAFAFSALVARR